MLEALHATGGRRPDQAVRRRGTWRDPRALRAHLPGARPDGRDFLRGRALALLLQGRSAELGRRGGPGWGARLRDVDDPVDGWRRPAEAVDAALAFGHANLVAHQAPDVQAVLSAERLSPLGRPWCVDVAVQRDVPLFFGPLIGRESVTVRAAASACAFPPTVKLIR